MGSLEVKLSHVAVSGVRRLKPLTCLDIWLTFSTSCNLLRRDMLYEDMIRYDKTRYVMLKHDVAYDIMM